MLEADKKRFGDRLLHVAEEALLARLLALTDWQKSAEELQALEEAMTALRRLKLERLGL